MRLQISFRLVPLIDPVDHAEECKGRGARTHRAFSMSYALHFRHQPFDEMYVLFLSRVNPLSQCRRQRMIFVQHDGDLAISRAENDFNMQPDQRTKTSLGIGNRACRSQHALLGDLHGVVHDLEQDFILALKVMIETAFAEFECGGDVVHRGRVVSALLEKAGGGAQDFLPGLNWGLTRHRVPWYTFARGITTWAGHAWQNQVCEFSPKMRLVSDL